MASCENYRNMITELAGGTLPKEESEELESHAGDCAECRERLAETRTLFGILKNIELPEPSAEFTESLASGVYEELRVSGAGLPGKVIRRPVWNGAWKTAAALAASLILVIGFWSFYRPVGPSVTEDRPPVVASDESLDIDILMEELERDTTLLAAMPDFVSEESMVEPEGLEWTEIHLDEVSMAEEEGLILFLESISEEEAKEILESLEGTEELQTTALQGVS